MTQPGQTGKRKKGRVVPLRTALLVLFPILTAAVTFSILWIVTVQQVEKSAQVLNPISDSTQIAALENENDYLRYRLSLLEEETAGNSTEAVVPSEETQTEVSADTLEREVETVPVSSSSVEDYLSVLKGLFPDEPAVLSSEIPLEEIVAAAEDLRDSVNTVPFWVTPDGELIAEEDIELDPEEIVYREADDTGYDSDGSPLVREIDYEAMGYTRPTAAVSYLDLTNGTSYSVNGDTMMFSASLIKAPYLYALLEQFALYDDIRSANPTNDPAVGQILSDEILEKYDFERKITVTEDMKEEGSGTIKDMDLTGGKEFTILELMQYAITVSDNTAFRILRNEFGYDYFYTVSKRLGISSVFTSFNQLTANEAVRYLAAMYTFAEEHPYEGGILIGLMKGANHTVMIPQALSGTVTAHKYGWDESSYHDMAIVFDNEPYAICIMTNFDFDRQSDDINAYMRSLATKTNTLHHLLYSTGLSED